MKYILLIILFAFQSTSYYAQSSDCRTDSKNIKLNDTLERSYNCEENAPQLNPKLSYNENFKQNRIIKTTEKRQQSIDNVSEFVKPLNYGRIDTRKSDERYQHNLDNFRVPEYTCVLPTFDDSDDIIKEYHQDIIGELHQALDDHYNCMLASGQRNRELFKQLITKGLDGKILPSKNNTIEWAIFPKYQDQTKLVMQNINQLYELRYKDYVDTHSKLRSVIRRYNQSLPEVSTVDSE